MNQIERACVASCVWMLLVAAPACGGDGGTTSSASRATCDRLLACSTALGSDQAGQYGTTYGKDGACWKAQTESQCESQCKTQIEGIMPASPENMTDEQVKACGVQTCSSNDDCAVFSDARICDASLKQCVQCKTDEDCGGTPGSCQGFDDTGMGTSVPCAQAATACQCN